MTMEQNAQPIRVAQMMTDMNYGGVEMVVMNYYRHMDRSRVQFDFFALEGSTLPQREEIERLGGRVYVVPKYTHLPQYEREIGRLFRQNGYQIVHSHMNTLSVLSLWGAKRAGVPNRIAHNHSTVGRGEGAKNVMKYLLRPFAAVYPTRLCACSRTAGSWLYGEKPFRVFNNAIELDRFTYDAAKRKAVRQELGLGDELVLGHVGRFCYAKNHEFLLDVMVEVCKQRPDAVLLLIGEGENEAAARRKACLPSHSADPPTPCRRFRAACGSSPSGACSPRGKGRRLCACYPPAPCFQESSIRRRYLFSDPETRGRFDLHVCIPTNG